MSRYIRGFVVVMAYDMAERATDKLDCLESVKILNRYGAMEVVRRSYYRMQTNPNAVYDVMDMVNRLARADNA